jgi:NAD(P)-dependent dehydrogenase (short-subunit alcohol dehydrogenase family)
MSDLHGKTAIVTGASRGIGAAIALELAQRGANVGLAVRRESTAREISDRITSSGGTCQAFECDVSSDQSVEALVENVTSRYGGLDILVNNAGTIQPIGPIVSVDPVAWRASIDVNLTGSFNCIRYSLPAMIERGAGVVINLLSGAARTPFEGWSSYCAAKSGLAMLTRIVHKECGIQGVRAVGFLPGVVDTDMQAQIRASGINPVSQLPRERLISVDEPARAIAWLCSSAADDWAGLEVDIRDEKFRIAAGLQ